MVKDRLRENGIVAVIRGKNHEEARGYVTAALEGGIKAIELTFTIPNMPELMKNLKAEFKDGIFGAGSVLNKEMAETAIENGAEYIVSPGYVEEVCKLCKEKNILYIPGCMTITEILKAMSNGNKLIKLFPGDLYGPGFIKAVKAPVPEVEIMPTGGVDIGNIKEWFNCGVTCVGVGSSLLKSNDLETIKNTAKEFVDKLKEVRNEAV